MWVGGWWGWGGMGWDGRACMEWLGQNACSAWEIVYAVETMVEADYE